MKKIFPTLVAGFLTAAHAHGDIGPCEGSVLERRVALISFGKQAKIYIKEHGELPDICESKPSQLQETVPHLLVTSQLCGSSEEGRVYYSCFLAEQASDPKASNTIETCQYDLAKQTLACENRTLITHMPD